MLEPVARAAKRRQKAETEWREAIRAAHSEGVPLRQIAKAADITHVRVLQIVRDQPATHTAEYRSAHYRVAKARGDAKECSRCGTTDPDKIYEWANLSGEYDNVADYERMCRSCHRKFDRARRGE